MEDGGALADRMASTQANASENPTNIPVSQSGSTAGIACKRKVAKNALGSRTDVGWEHGISVGEDGKKIQLSYELLLFIKFSYIFFNPYSLLTLFTFGYLLATVGECARETIHPTQHILPLCLHCWPHPHPLCPRLPPKLHPKYVATLLFAYVCHIVYLDSKGPATPTPAWRHS
ncbi:hypothetical protein Ahy_B05g077469 [Arachis hypogaea]|uniref:Uncharacterized protein n=1 Tax=Arachis hypogaea TaxID=3818 RepID=A0A444Z5G9_ARAHY|nr:hypothetical protein Ahy_B05g077469 [Arachis hypogaea]